MDVRIFQYRIARWLEMLVVVLTLAASCAAQAVVESIPRQMLWYLGNQPYPSADAACAATKWTKPDCYATGAIPWSASSDEYFIMYMACTGFCPSLGTLVLWAPIGYSDCPSATTYPYPSIPFKYNPKSGMCERDVPEQVAYTLTLSGGTEVEPSNGSDKKFLPIIATVKDQNDQPPTTPVRVRISLKVDPQIGGHDHGDSTRPRGGIAEVETCASDAECWPCSQSTDGKGMTDRNGQVVFNFNAPEASGTHTISATCEGCSNTATKPVNVKVDGLKPIPAFSFYALNETNGDVIGARPGWHTDNHNLTPAASQKLMQIASWYRFLPQFKVVVDKSTGKKGLPPPLHINDASLPWGGVYDICARPGACPDIGVILWKKPHAEHRHGTVVDVRANGADGSIPASNKAKFLKLLQKKGMSYLHESRGTSNEHFHVRVLGN